jgi:hypothetical protein
MRNEFELNEVALYDSLTMISLVEYIIIISIAANMKE